MLDASGVSFLDCIVSLPSMYAHLAPLGVQSRLVRGRIAEVVDERSDVSHLRHSITIQPGDQRFIEAFRERIKFDANCVERIECIEFRSGFSVSWSSKEGVDDVFAQIPDAFCLGQDVAFFPDRNHGLNEFGYYYVSLYMLGMLSRYYPDLWHAEIDASTNLSIAAESLLDAACQRLPVLALGELENAYFLTP